MGTPTPLSSPRGLRVGDAERDGAARALSEHFAAGRLQQEEFDVRLGAVMAAVTYADLDRQFLDLPPVNAPAAPHATPFAAPPHHVGARRFEHRRSRLPTPILVVLILAVAVVVGHSGPFLLIPLIWLWFARRVPRRPT